MKIAKPAFTAEFRDLAVKRVKAGESVGGVAKELGGGRTDLAQLGKGSGEGHPKWQGQPDGDARREGTVTAASGECAAQAGA